MCVASLTLGVACNSSPKTDAAENEEENVEEVTPDEVIADAADDAVDNSTKATLTLTVEEDVTDDLKAIAAKGGFEPCTAVFFKDDLKGEKAGEFPSKWDIANGSAEVAEFDGRKVIKLSNNDAEIFPLVVGDNHNYLPEVFTIDFDYYCNGEAEGDFNACYHLWLRGADNGNMSEITLATEDCLSWNVLKENDDWAQGSSGQLQECETRNAWNHFTLFFDHGTLKVFVNGERLISMPKVKAPACFAICGEGWDDHRYYFTNMRMATINEN